MAPKEAAGEAISGVIARIEPDIPLAISNVSGPFCHTRVLPRPIIPLGPAPLPGDLNTRREESESGVYAVSPSRSWADQVRARIFS